MLVCKSFYKTRKNPDTPIKSISSVFAGISALETIKLSANTAEYEVIREADGTIRDPAVDTEFATVPRHYKAILFGGKGNFWAGAKFSNPIKFTPYNTTIMDKKINPNRLMYIDLLIKYDGSKSAIHGDFSKQSFEKWVRIEQTEHFDGRTTRISYRLRGVLPDGGYENYLWLQSYDEL